MPEAPTTVDRIRKMIIDEMYLEGVTYQSLDNDAPLFGEGLCLDSLDAIELVLLVKAHFDVTIRSSEEGLGAFRSINALAEFIENRRLES